MNYWHILSIGWVVAPSIIVEIQLFWGSIWPQIVVWSSFEIQNWQAEIKVDTPEFFPLCSHLGSFYFPFNVSNVTRVTTHGAPVSSHLSSHLTPSSPRHSSNFHVHCHKSRQFSHCLSHHPLPPPLPVRPNKKYATIINYLHRKETIARVIGSSHVES